MSNRNPIRLLKWLCTVARATVLRPLVRVLVILLVRARRISELARSCFKSWVTYLPTWRSEPSTKDVPLASPSQVSTSSTCAITLLSSTLPLSLQPHHAHGQSQSPTPSPSTRPSVRSTTPSLVTVATPDVIPVAPGNIPRHERRKAVEKVSNKTNIVPGQVDYADKAPDGWERAVHPEGACYFFNANKHVFTDIDLTQSRNLADIEEYIKFLREKERRVLPNLNPRTHLVIQLLEVDGFRAWCYYFVDHDSRVIFWVQDFNATELLADLQGVIANSHISESHDDNVGCSRYAIEMQYWLHCEQFPCCIPVSQDHVTEVWGIVVRAHADCITSESALSTLDEAQLGKIIALVPYLQARANTIDDSALWVVARVMGNFARVKFYNFYGQPGARLEPNLSVYAKTGIEPEENTLLFALLDFLLFYTPSAHFRELEGISVDNVINYARWRSFANKLNNEWNGFTIFSTVMLAVDVSFLAVPGVDKGAVGSQLVTTVATYMSLLSVGGSLLASVLLARQSRAEHDSALFISRMACWGGCRALGVIFSLPFAFLVWAMIFFVLALCYVILHSSDPVTLGVMIPGAVLVAILTFMPVWWGLTQGELVGIRIVGKHDPS
ncbi:hypothetical protein BS17DRAFT_807002 [Gyrodon lividus]|nr:hypothetical protein BS17DRAFT_807002 [Gyrodon lividus]